MIGAFVVRYRYIFFGMLNLAFSMVLYSILEKFFYITGGSDGMRLERPSFFGVVMERAEFEVAHVLSGPRARGRDRVAACTATFARRPARRWSRSRSNETRLEYLGVSAHAMLLIGYVVSAVLAGLGGTILAVIQGVVTPEFGYWIRSGEFVFIAILGGTGHVIGAFAGALVYELVRSYAAAFAADIWQLTLGVFLLLIILFASRGLVGLYQDLMTRLLGPPRDVRPLSAGQAEG